MKLFHILFCTVLGLAAFTLPAAAQHAQPRRPNIILIVADGLGAGDLSCYGQTQFQTPHLDQLAAGGIRFTNYIAGSAASAPARAALLLGKNTSSQPDADYSLNDSDITVADSLSRSGYMTCVIGEWNLGDQNSAGAPWHHGFHEFGGYFNPADCINPYPDYLWKYGETPTPDGNYKVFNDREELYYNTAGQKGMYIPDSMVQWTMNFSKEYRQDKYNHRPFFVMLDETIPGNGYHEVPSDAPFSDEPWPQAERNRAATIARLDDSIGKLVSRLTDQDEVSNTVIFFTSDTVPRNGGGVDPKYFHENAGTNDLHVPFIVSWPGTIPGGQVSGVSCSARDFLPTAAAIGRSQTPQDVEGVSLLPVIFGREASRN
ncbi:MAG TPA: sulfatase-like hydrolase/transferase [Candidatus Sulfotelmatobacter sp.]|nr:sulfatase-like hydrolase/transferase [Candidatus Sulfotelmatobacter sp.]